MLNLIYLHFAVKLFELRHQLKIRHLPYDKNIDRALRKGPNPYSIQEAFPYGETPLFVLKQIVDRWGLTPDDRFVDLGCGRGRGVFFLSALTGCHAHGIDKIASFIKRANAFKKPKNSFSCGDFKTYDFTQATFVYLYGTTMDNAAIAQLAEALRMLPQSGKIVTVSYPLEGFILKDQFTASFPWGKAEVYLNYSPAR